MGSEILSKEINVERLCNTYGIPDEVKLTVQHILLSHHGIPEYGSPKVPVKYLTDKSGGLPAFVMKIFLK